MKYLKDIEQKICFCLSLSSDWMKERIYDAECEKHKHYNIIFFRSWGPAKEEGDGKFMSLLLNKRQKNEMTTTSSRVDGRECGGQR